MFNPSVSVVIATYNRGPKIGKTLDSVLDQIRPASEIIVSDDGSTDDTAEWIRRRYPSVRVESFANGGTSLARNRGAALANGEVLLFIDHDDEMLPSCIETLVQLLASFPTARAAYADHTYRSTADGVFIPNHHNAISSFGRLRSIVALATGADGRLYDRSMYYALLHGNLLQQPWAIYRKSFTALGGFDPDIRYCEDWELFLRVSATVPLAVTDRVVSHHSIEGGNLHRMAGQEGQHMKVLRKHIRATGWRDPRALLVLRRRLALYYKTAGDRHWPTEPVRAWREYLSSAAAWPFDHVVAARCLMRPFQAFHSALRRGPRS
jgi:glycosyltransferase involved in cell wall biosynthesis